MTARRLRDWSLGLGLGSVGGALFAALDLPLPWMMGAMTFTTAAALAGLPIQVPGRLRWAMIAVLGLMLGSAFTPAILGQLGRWLVSLGGLLTYVTVTTLAVAWYFRKVTGFGPVTAYFAAAPGGLNEMVVTGAALGGDERRIALTHALRILLIVFTVPVWFRLFGGYQTTGMASAMGSIATLAPIDAVVLTASAAAGAVLARWARLPAPLLTGPMLLSAAFHLASVTEARPPAELVALAQLVTGAAIGARFAGTRLALVGGTVLASTGATAIMLVLSLGATAILAPLTGLPAAALVLAFVPGGLAEMSLISIALGIDVAFVSTHHFARIVFVVMMAPLAFRLLRRGAKEEERER